MALLQGFKILMVFSKPFFFPLNSIFSDAIHYLKYAFEHHSVSHLKTGLVDIAHGLRETQVVLTHCPGMEELAVRLGTTIARLDNAIGDIIEVTKIMVHGINIAENVKDAVEDWKGHHYVKFGGHIGRIVLDVT